MTETPPPIPAGLAPPDRHHKQAGSMGAFHMVIWMCVAGGLMFLAMGYNMATSQYTFNHQTGWLMGLLGLPCLGTGAWLWYWHKNQTSMGVWTTPDGIAWRSAFKEGFARWDEVVKHYRLVMEIYHQGRHARTNIWLTIETASGQQVVFREFVQHILDLANRIDTEIAKRQLAGTLARVRNGEAAQFGKLGISNQWISWKGATLPWGDVEAIETQFGYFTIRKKGKWLSWANFAIGDIPNFPVFNAVLQEVHPAAPAPKS